MATYTSGVAKAAAEAIEMEESHDLLAISKLSALVCYKENRKWYACKAQSSDPRVCQIQNEEAVICTNNLLAEVRAKCGDSYEAYSSCLRKAGATFADCRKEMDTFHGDCVKTHFIERIKSADEEGWERQMNARWGRYLA
mmetsp:Transcript_3649/g.9977  ORF Transcript_3649/g.9977 Transcript_3649/m.9977 type:complete len:140 (+) Transcript_3649:80-499(+)